jgi:uncharacterized RDD family membrane protein YckC
MNPNTVPTNQPPAPTSATPRARRFASMMYEGVLLFAVVFISDYLFDTLTQSKHALVLRHTRMAWLFIAIGMYFIACWVRSGQTLPMKAWNIRLVSQNGYKPTLLQLVIRYVLMWVFPVLWALIVKGLIMITQWPAMNMFIVLAPFTVFLPTWFTPDQQFVHDILAKTRLVNTSKNP